MTKQQIGTFRVVGRLLAFSASFVAGVACADTTWNNTAGGDMADPNNWSNGLPSSGTTAINPPISGPLTLSEDINTGSSYIWFNHSGNSAFDLTLNLGAERTLTCPARTFVKPKAVVTLANGTWKMTGDRFFVGDNWSDSTFIVNGANSALYGHTNGNYYIEVGSSNGSNSKNNLLLVRNGGLVNGGVIVGRLANPDSREFCGTNTFHVTGTGSRLVSSLYPLDVGCQQGLSQAIIDDHATATLSKGFRLGASYGDGNPTRYYAGDQNYLLVSGGAVLSAAGDGHVGYSSASNLFEVAGGATATVARLYTSYDAKDTVRNGRVPFGNRVVVHGEDSRLVVNGETHLGQIGNSYGDSLLITDGASLTNCGAFYIGVGGWGNAVRVVNGGKWITDQYLLVGHHSRSNLLEIADGGTLTLTGAQLRQSFNQLQDGAPNGWNTVWVHGAGAKLTVSTIIRVGRFADSFCDAMRIEDGGVLLQASGEFQTPFNAKLNEVNGARGGTSSNFVLSVTGAGSVYDFQGGDFTFCCNDNDISTNMFNRIYVADGGLLSITRSACCIAGGKAVETAYCEDNMMHIGPGGRFLQVIATNNSNDRNFRLGNNLMARRNMVRVEGSFAYTNTAAAYNTSAGSFRIGNVGSSNRLEVVNGGDMTVNGASFAIGFSANAVGNSTYVGTNSVLRLANMEVAHFGASGHSSRFTVDGGALDAYDTWRVCVGTTLSASNCVFEVLNGATATVSRLVLADKSPNCLGIVSNATLNIVAHKDAAGNSIPYVGYLDLAYSAEAAGTSDPANMRFVIAGRYGKVRADDQVRIRNASAKIVFQIPAEGFAETPLVVKNFADVTQGASIVVEAAEDWPYGAKQTLVELASGQTFSAAVNNLAVTSTDDRLCVRRSTNSIYVYKPNGTMMIFR
jgi:hypothetical protein